MHAQTAVKPIAPNELDTLHQFVQEDLGRVNTLIIEHIHSHVPLVSRIARHLILAGGKRMRPLLTLASAALCNYAGNEHIPLAASVEFIHAATLMHDDVIDEGLVRRGKPSAYAVWGSKPNILVGDFLFSQAFQLMVSVQSLPVLDILAKATAIIVEGEVHQLTVLHKLDLTREDYLKIITAKTATLFAAACAVSGVLAGRSSAEVQGLHQYGHNLGLAFQLSDDVLDYTADTKALGKQVGDDFKEGKATLPVLYAYQLAPEDEKEFWQRTMVELNQNELDFRRACQLLQRHQVFAQTLTLAEEYSEKAKQALEVFPNSPIKDAMVALADFAVHRGY